MLSKYVPIIIATMIFYVVMVFGLIAFIIPGIFLTIKLMFYEYGILLDNEGVINSLKRSWKITKGNWWRLLVLSSILSAPILISAVSSIWLPKNIYIIVYFLVLLFAMPWSLSSLTFAYLRLREIEITASGGK